MDRVMLILLPFHGSNPSLLVCYSYCPSLGLDLQTSNTKGPQARSSRPVRLPDGEVAAAATPCAHGLTFQMVPGLGMTPPRPQSGSSPRHMKHDAGTLRDHIQTAPLWTF